jgi:aromatic ring hydroxylase
MYKQIAALILISAFVPANNVLFYALLLMFDVEYTHDDIAQTHRISVGLVKLIKFGFALQMSRPPPRTRQRFRVRPPRPSVKLGALN